MSATTDITDATTDTDTAATPDADVRHHLASAQAWVAGLLTGISDDQWDLPTPCDEFDVRALVGHLLAVQERVRRMGRDGALGDAPLESASPGPDAAAEFTRVAAEALAAWDDQRMGTTVVAPWGVLPAPAVVGGYVAEHVVHGWDLAVATGQPSEAPEDVAGPALRAMLQALPADGRDRFPFADAVEPAPDAGLTERLANWTGRSSRGVRSLA